MPRPSPHALARALVLLAGLAWSAPAPAITYPATAAEEVQLAAREVVLRTLPSTDGRVRVVGIAEIHAGRDATWKALLDFEGRLGGNPSLRSVSAYRPATATEEWYRWEVSHFGYTVVYYNHYRIDRAAGTLLHELDPEQVSDLRFSRGSYELGPSPANPDWTRLSYLVESDFGRAIPGFLQEWLCGGGVRDFLADLVTRAERAGAP